jgi:hypothetical protein
MIGVEMSATVSSTSVREVELSAIVFTLCIGAIVCKHALYVTCDVVNA